MKSVKTGNKSPTRSRSLSPRRVEQARQLLGSRGRSPHRQSSEPIGQEQITLPQDDRPPSSSGWQSSGQTGAQRKVLASEVREKAARELGELVYPSEKVLKKEMSSFVSGQKTPWASEASVPFSKEESEEAVYLLRRPVSASLKSPSTKSLKPIQHPGGDDGGGPPPGETGRASASGDDPHFSYSGNLGGRNPSQAEETVIQDDIRNVALQVRSMFNDSEMAARRAESAAAKAENAANRAERAADRAERAEIGARSSAQQALNAIAEAKTKAEKAINAATQAQSAAESSAKSAASTNELYTGVQTALTQLEQLQNRAILSEDRAQGSATAAADLSTQAGIAVAQAQGSAAQAADSAQQSGSSANAAADSAQKAAVAAAEAEESVRMTRELVRDEAQQLLENMLEQNLDRRISRCILDFCGIHYTVPKKDLGFKTALKFMNEHLEESLNDEKRGLARFSAKLRNPDYVERVRIKQAEVVPEIVPADAPPRVPRGSIAVTDDFELPREDREVSLAFTFPLKAVKVSGLWDRHRFFIEPSIFLEKSHGKLVGGIKFQLETLLSANTLSPSAGDKNGIRNHSRVSLGIGPKNDFHLFWWKDSGKTYRRFEYDRTVALIKNFPNHQTEPVVGFGCFIETEKGEHWYEKLSLKNGYILVGVDGQLRPKPFIFVKGSAKILLGLPNTQKSQTEQPYYPSSENNQVLGLVSSSAAEAEFQLIKQSLIQQENKLNAINSKLELILDERLFSAINSKLYKILELIQNDIQKNLNKAQENLSQNCDFIQKEQTNLSKSFGIIQADQTNLLNTLNSSHQALENKIQQINQKIESIPEQIKNKVDICVVPTYESEKAHETEKQEKPEFNPDNFIQNLVDFLTSYYLAQGIVLGVASGVLYIILTDTQLKAKDPWIKLGLRICRRTISYAYPLALLVSGLNCGYNYVTNRPLLNKWPLFKWLSFSKYLPNSQLVHPSIYLVGILVFSAYGWYLSGTSLWLSLQFISANRTQPYYIFRLGIGFVITRMLYRSYYNWILNPDDQTQVDLLDSEDSIKTLVLNPFVVLKQKFSNNKQALSVSFFEIVIPIYDLYSFQFDFADVEVSWFNQLHIGDLGLDRNSLIPEKETFEPK